jgi:hypothetical protein
MGQLEHTFQTIVHSVPECLAAGYVDITTGALLEMHTADPRSAQGMELFAGATSQLFGGGNFVLIDSLFRRARGASREGGQHYFNEMIVNSEDLVHIFLRVKSAPHFVVCFIVRKSANLGTALARARSSLSGIESAL